jgi:3-oxoadipate enol-lactonase
MLANVQGINIYYEAVGEGLPVVFVHGLGSTSNVWHGQRVTLSKFFRIITLDLPGAGRSDKSESSYSMDRWSEQIAGLADVLQIPRFVLVGHSMTTILAQLVAARHAGRVAGLVLCGPLTELPSAGKDAFLKRAELVQNEGMVAVADTVLAGALSLATREGNPVLAGLYRDMLMANDPRCYAGHCHALRAASARAEQTKIQCPTLILVGEQDTVTPLTNGRAIAAAVAGARVRLIPWTAHLTMAERPDFFNSALTEFLLGL